MADAEQPLKTYRGNCHCGAFVYEVKVPEIKSVSECNCSICYKKGYLWIFPAEDAFTVVKGDDASLKEYTFNSKTTVHKFCPDCGSGVMAVRPGPSGGITRAVNARCLQGLNTWELERKPFDGDAMDPKYQPPKYDGPEPTADVDGGKLYTGSCHCGALTVAVKTVPLDKEYPARIVECNCSLCERNAYVWIYPKVDQVVLQGDDDKTGKYRFARRMLEKTFCKNCGIPVANLPADLTPDEFGALNEGSQKWFERSKTMTPVNLRVLNDFHYKEAKDTERMDSFNSIPPKYENP